MPLFGRMLLFMDSSRLHTQSIFLNSGVQAVMAVEHAHVTDVITIKAPAADTMLPK